MQTPSFSSSRILLPVRRWFVVLSLLVALLLCSPEGSYINGAEIAVDGGMRL